jgi:alkaline phosphatase
MDTARFSWRAWLPALIGLLLAAAAAIGAAPAPRPRNLVVLIADGCGPASFALARAVAGSPLALDSVLVGACLTASADSRITDSGAAATALATGTSTRNGAVAVDTAGRPLGTLLEAAEARGMATGVVVTCRITHATPAAFVAHVAHRSDETAIAAQIVDFGLEVAFGGGRREFVPEPAGGQRRDDRDLTAEAAARGMRVIGDAAALSGPLRSPVLGLFADSHMDYELDRDGAREPSLADMTARALELLSDDLDGFVLMVEGSRIDHAAHDHDAATHAREVLAYDEAVRVVLEFARRDGRTLVVSTADHETGGLTLGRAGEDHGGGWDPAPLRAARGSAERIARRIGEGADAAKEMAAGAGVRDLAPDEAAALAAATTLAARRDVVAAALNRRAGLGWTTRGHTGIDVGLYAFGPGAEAFRGAHTNAAIGRALARALGLDLAAETQRLREAPAGRR